MTPEESTSARRFELGRLTSYVRDVFVGHDLSNQDVSVCASALVSADLRGVWSHGVARLSIYCSRLIAGAAKPDPTIQINDIFPSVALIDGDDGLGLIVARKAMSVAIERARKMGIGLVGVRKSGYFGMGALYIQQAIDADCLGWSFTNASKALPPWGGRSAFFGMSPFGFGAPVAENSPPFLIDIAMSMFARGKLKYTAQRGEVIGFDFVEVAPMYDPTGIACQIAVDIMVDFIGSIFLERRKDKE